MRTIEIKAYLFNELSEEAKEKAVQNLSNINVQFDWWHFIYEDAKNIGLKITSFDLYRNKHANGEFLLSAAEVAANIISSHGESCETYKTAKFFLDDFNPVFASYLDENSQDYESTETEEKLNDLETEFLNSLLIDYANMLQNECEFLQEDEQIIETILANEYEFTEEGELI